MKNTPLQSFIADYLARMFIVSKRGKMVFFPWGDKKQGYLLDNKSVVEKTWLMFRTSDWVKCEAWIFQSQN